jgi:hypothetical protein
LQAFFYLFYLFYLFSLFLCIVGLPIDEDSVMDVMKFDLVTELAEDFPFPAWQVGHYASLPDDRPDVLTDDEVLQVWRNPKAIFDYANRVHEKDSSLDAKPDRDFLIAIIKEAYADSKADAFAMLKRDVQNFQRHASAVLDFYDVQGVDLDTDTLVDDSLDIDGRQINSAFGVTFPSLPVQFIGAYTPGSWCSIVKPIRQGVILSLSFTMPG